MKQLVLLWEVLRVTDERKRALEHKQKILMNLYKKYEAMQRDFSYDTDFYSYAESQMQRLIDEAEHIRGLLEGRWSLDV